VGSDPITRLAASVGLSRPSDEQAAAERVVLSPQLALAEEGSANYAEWTVQTTRGGTDLRLAGIGHLVRLMPAEQARRVLAPLRAAVVVRRDELPGGLEGGLEIAGRGQDEQVIGMGPLRRPARLGRRLDRERAVPKLRSRAAPCP
jgi:hypothetical protein